MDTSIKDFYYGTVVPSHEGQMYGSEPYKYHLQEVRKEWVKLFQKCASRVEEYHAELACLGHDILEDCPQITIDTLKSVNVPQEVIDAIVLVTKTKKVSYHKYLSDIAEDELAFQVKVADTYSNMTHSIKEGSTKRVLKYSEQIRLLYLYRKEYLSDGITSYTKDKQWSSEMSKRVHGG